MRRTFVALALATSASAEVSQLRANPVRKVVTLLQNMQAKVTKEGEKEKELYEKFMCYCKTSSGDLAADISGADTKMPALSADIEKTTELKAQTEADLKQAQTDRAAAKEAMSTATAIREKEAAAFAAEKAESEANLKALKGAVAAMSKGMAGSFLQTSGAAALKKIVQAKEGMIEEDREEIMEFLQGSSEYAPQSGEIAGILKQLGDEMQKGLDEAIAAEEGAIKAYEELMAAKKKEIAALTQSIETKMQKVGELGVSIAEMKGDLSDTEEAHAANLKFAAELEKGCKTKTAEWEEIKKVRAEELVALADTIKILNDDDALDLFKKTLPSASSSFVQMQVSADSVRARALAVLSKSPRMNFITLALRGKKIGFEKVIKMIDEMVATLKEEQLDDDHKKEYCAQQFDITEDKVKGLERKITDSENAIEVAKESIAQLTEEIAALEASVKETDKQVAEATENRKEENEDFKELMASDTAAKELLNIAKNRLNKFYNPKLYKAPPKQELTEAERISVNMGGTPPPTAAPGGIAGTGVTVFAQIRAHVQLKSVGAPPPPPETFGAYTKKSGESGGVIAMIDMLIKDLDKEMTVAETEEKDAQADYEEMMKESASKRTTDTKALTDKGAAKADAETTLQEHTDSKAATEAELMATHKYLSSLHAECDWLMQYYDVRKEARTSEIDALGKAKAVLSGADYSLLQTRSSGFLSRQ